MNALNSKNRLHVYVIQLFPPAAQLFINYELSSNHAPILNKLRSRRGLERAILRPDLVGHTGAIAPNELKSFCEDLIQELTDAGYEPIAGGALHSDCWQTYVIHIDSPESNMLYVGQTHYPIELRFKQHLYGFKSARIFHKHTPHSFAYELFDRNTYKSQREATSAEKALAESLRERGFSVTSS